MDTPLSLLKELAAIKRYYPNRHLGKRTGHQQTLNVPDDLLSRIDACVADHTDTPRERKFETPLTRCAAHNDGDCTHPECPQIRDKEPEKSGRHCPLDTWGDDE